MENIEDKIKQAAIKFAKEDDSLGLENCSRWEFISGIKSPEAKKYWQQGMYTEERVVNLLHKFKTTILESIGYTYTPQLSTTKDWFNRNKKK